MLLAFTMTSKYGKTAKNQIRQNYLCLLCNSRLKVAKFMLSLLATPMVLYPVPSLTYRSSSTHCEGVQKSGRRSRIYKCCCLVGGATQRSCTVEKMSEKLDVAVTSRRQTMIMMNKDLKPNTISRTMLSHTVGPTSCSTSTPQGT